MSEKTVLVSVETSHPYFFSTEESMQELSRLATTAGAEVVGELYQKRESPDPTFFLGKGKVQELGALCRSLDAKLVIFDQDINSAQENNISEELNIKVINRTELILDIFALHAHTREGKLQVELAQTEFSLTRLVGQGTELSRLGGGIGTRGPGETKLENDRRVIRKKVSELKKELKDLKEERSLRREKRRDSQFSQVSLVGYTNSGKSTLLNSLTKAGVYAADKLFATLDTTTRRLYLPNGKTILLSDTVGFIQHLPHQLIDAFSATLEEVKGADLLVQVVDAANPHFEAQIQAVYGVLEDLGVITKPMLTVFNKADLLDRKLSAKILEKYAPALVISAKTGNGIDKFKEKLAELLK